MYSIQTPEFPDEALSQAFLAVSENPPPFPKHPWRWGTEGAQVGKKLPRHQEKASSLREKVDRSCVCVCKINAGRLHHFLALTPK